MFRYKASPVPPANLFDRFFCNVKVDSVKKLEPTDQIVKIDEELGIAWILLPPDEALGGFRGISPRVMDEEKFLSAKKQDTKKKG